MTIELYECESCSAKPGSPALCVTCLENRARAGGAWKGPRRHFAVPEAIVGQMPMPTAYDRDQQALRDRLDAALRRIEQLEADVARLKGPTSRVLACDDHDWEEPKLGFTTCTKCHAFKRATTVSPADRYQFVQHHDLTGEPLNVDTFPATATVSISPISGDVDAFALNPPLPDEGT